MRMLEMRTMKNRIQEIRRTKHIKQRELASTCDMDTGHLSRIENAHVDPTLSTAKKISDALGLPVREVFELDEEAA